MCSVLNKSTLTTVINIIHICFVFFLPGGWPIIPWPLCLRTTAPLIPAGTEVFAGRKRTPSRPASRSPAETDTRDVDFSRVLDILFMSKRANQLAEYGS